MDPLLRSCVSILNVCFVATIRILKWCSAWRWCLPGRIGSPRMSASRPCVPWVSPSCSLLSLSRRSFKINLSKSGPGSFQINTSALSLRMCEIFCASFKSRGSVSHSSLNFPKPAPLAFKAKHSGAHSQSRSPGLGAQGCPMGDSDSSSLGRSFAIDYPPICGSYIRECGA